MALRVWSSRLAVAAAVLLSVTIFAPVSAFAAGGTTVSGTVYSKDEGKETIVLITDAFGVKNQPITIDLSDFSKLFQAVGVGQSISLEILTREDDAYLAIGLVSEGSYVGQQDLGVREEFQTKESSIKAHVGNVPEDDESLSQQHRDNNLKRDQDDDDDNNGHADPT
jgi:hypothetical protein